MRCWRWLFSSLLLSWLLLEKITAAQQPDVGVPMVPENLGLIERLPPPDSLEPYVDEEALLWAPRAELPPEPEPPRRSTVGSPGEDRSPLRVGSWWIPSQGVRGQATELSYSGLQANLAFPLYIEPTGRSIWIALAALEHLELGGSAILPDSLTPLPNELWKLTAGVLHRREFENDWRAGFLLNVGTASDDPGGGLRDMTLTSVFFLTVPHGPRDAWELSLFYSPTSQLPFPIPGLAYVWRPSDRLTANIGIPFSFRYQPTDTFTVSASYRPLTNVAVRAEQQLVSGWSLYASYLIVNETYWLSDRVNDQDRLYLFDQRVALGLERQLPFGFTLDLAGAYVFDRRIFQAESFSGDRRDELAIDPGMGLSLLLRWSR